MFIWIIFLFKTIKTKFLQRKITYKKKNHVILVDSPFSNFLQLGYLQSIVSSTF